MSASEETVLWKGTPAASVDFWLNLSSILILPLPWVLVRWIQRRNHHIEITSERIRVTRGVFSRQSEDLELYRVRDLTFQQPFILRVCGAGTLVLTTSDSSSPQLTLAGIPADDGLRDRLRAAVEACRDRKRARVAELGGTMDLDGDAAAAG